MTASAEKTGFSLYQDQTLRCRDCGQDFTFTAGEQEFYASRGLNNAPSRCPDCRAARKASNGGGGYRSGGGGGGGYQRSERQMFDAVCANCGRATQVPFQPRGDRPVYCSDCFEQQGGGRRSSNY
jgi:CxxC-x17-CxxC domain-containing protein